MRRRDVQLSPWFVDLDRDPLRDPPRPLSLRHEDYEDHFDFTAVFYDCFWNSAGDEIVLIGPPLLNLEQDLGLAIIAHPSMAPCELSLSHAFLGCQIVVKPPVGTTGLIMQTDRRESFIAPQPNLCELFRNRRTAVTLSRNNELTWIRDWVAFNKHYHKCTGVLIYDNDTDAYDLNDVYDYLEPIADGMRIVVLSWPFKYGVPDWRLPVSYGMLDSLYCQAGMLEHARHRFLSRSSSVLNTDIDELVLTERGSSVFELVEGSTTGLLAFGGVWVENRPITPEGIARRPSRFRDFAWIGTGDQVGCENKWAVVPARVPAAAQWHVHRILGMPPSDCRELVEMRHFKAINTDWTVDRNRSQERRTSSGATDSRPLRLDVALQDALVKIFPDEPSEVAARDGSGPSRSAYAWRVRGGRLAAEGKWQEAVEAVKAASSLMPEHPGFRLFLASLLEREKNEGAARALRVEAEALRLRDPWYHVQRGRWLHDEGDPVAAHSSFARAVEIDPKFTVAYHEMARNQYHWGHGGRPAKADAILDACARGAPDDALTRALLAQELERKGRLHDALPHIEAATALDPENPHYHSLHARVLRRIGRLNAAEEAARRGVARDDLSRRMRAFGRHSAVEGWREYQWRAPTAPEVHAELAEILVAKGDWAAAEAAARSALWYASTESERHCRLSEILATRGGVQEAAAELEAAIRLAREDLRRPTPHDWPLTSRNRSLEARAGRLSRILGAAGRTEEAVEVLRGALVAVPDSSAIQQNLATLLADGGAGEAAAALLRSAIVRRPENARLRHALSKILEGIDPQEAIASARIAAELEPDNPSFQDHLVRLLLAARRTDEAARALAKALPLNSWHGPLYFALSRVLQRRQRPAEALISARRAVALDPRTSHLREHLVALLLEAGEDVEAEAALHEALQLDPGAAALHFHRSRLLQRRRRPQEALAAARHAVELEPLRAKWRDHLATLLMETGQLEEAEAALRQALERKVESGSVYFRLSRLLQQRRRSEEALAAARRAVALEPQKPYLREHFVALLVEWGEDAEAEAALGDALERHPGDAALHFHQSRLLQRRRCPERALAAARMAVALDPERPRWHDQLAALLVEAGRPEEAEAALRQAFGRKVESGGMYFRLSRLLQGKRPKEALAVARRAVALEPQKPYLREHLIALLIEAGEDAEAEAALCHALEFHAGEAALHFQRSRLLQQRRRTEEAVAAARRAVALDPQRPRWRDHLAALLVQAGRPEDAEAAPTLGTGTPSVLQFPSTRSDREPDALSTGNSVGSSSEASARRPSACDRHHQDAGASSPRSARRKRSLR
jgi:tetratricopeptide (TPR) repeat protein